MAAPTFVAEYESAWNTSADKTVAVTTAVDDVLVALCSASNWSDSSDDISAPTGGTGLTWAQQETIFVSDYCAIAVFTCTAASVNTGANITVSLSGSPDALLGVNILRFSGSNGIGAAEKTNVLSGGPSLAITTTQANSALCAISADWNAVDGASRTWRTVNGITPSSGNGLEKTYFRDAAQFTVYAAIWDDAGTAASKTVGLSAPTGQKYAIAVVEVLGTAGDTPISLADAGSAAEALAEIVTVPLADTAASAEAVTASVTGVAATDTASAADAPAVAAAVPTADSAAGSDALVVAPAVPLPDTATTTEALSATAVVAPADTATSTEAVTASAALDLADAAAASDALLVDTGGGTPKALPDAAAAADTLTATATAGLAEAASAAEALTLAAASALADAASAVDAAAVAVAAGLGDAGIAGDTLAVTVLAGLADTGASAEAVTAAVTLAVADTGAAVDAGTGQDASFIPKALPDIGAAVDRLRILIVRPNSGVISRPYTGVILRP
jgi:hypothetical protein